MVNCWSMGTEIFDNLIILISCINLSIISFFMLSKNSVPIDTNDTNIYGSTSQNGAYINE